MPTFNPPTTNFQYPTGSRLLDRMRPKRGIAVWSTDSGVTWQQGVFPSQDQLIGAEGTFWFLGGHRYTITSAQATTLTNAGYGSYIT